MTPNKQVHEITTKTLSYPWQYRGKDFACRKHKKRKKLKKPFRTVHIVYGEKSLVMEHAGQRGLNTKRPTIVFFLGPTKPSPSYD